METASPRGRHITDTAVATTMRAGAKLRSVDPLREDDIARARATPPAERARQAFEMMRTGIALKRTSLRRRHPRESEADLEVRLLRWLAREDGSEPEP
jgi:hypothetical protein